MSFWGRRRDIALLITVVVLQLILLGYQVRREGDMSLLRAWSVGAISPVNKALHGVFSAGSNFLSDYVWLIGARRENEDLWRERERLQLENDDLRRNLERLQRSGTLLARQDRLASKTMIAEVIGGALSSHSREIILSRGRRNGIRPGMAVITGDGIVGKVQASYPGSSLVLLISDPESGVGVVLGGSRVRGVLKGRGSSEPVVDYVAREIPVDLGEIIYTSGDDRVYPKGLRVGRVTRLEAGTDFREIHVEPFARLDRLDEALVIIDGVHEELPPRRRPQISETLLAPPLEDQIPAEPARPDEPDPTLTDADRVRERYRAIAEAQGVQVGETNPDGRAPDFNLGASGRPPPPAVEGDVEP